jgi:hypothetical protein
MRLFQRNDDGTFSLTEEYYRDIPPYAILSHRWYEATEEATLIDIFNGKGVGTNTATPSLHSLPIVLLRIA